MPVQSAYTLNHGKAYPGMVSDLQLCNVVSRLNKSTSVTIPFGYGVVTDGDDGAKLPVAGSTLKNFNGIAMRELNRETFAITPATLGAVPQRDFAVVTVGNVWVTARVAVAKDDPVFLVVGDGTGTNQGQFSNVIGAAATLAIAIPNATWETTAAAGALAQISIVLGG